MEIYHLDSGTIRVCTKEEARQSWKDEPAKRHEIWSEEEFDKYMLSDSETVNNVMAWKRNKPGSYL